VKLFISNLCGVVFKILRHVEFYLCHNPAYMKYAITDLNVIEINITGTLLSDKLPWAWGHDLGHSRTQSPSYARCDEGLWPNPKPETIKTW
jgi:hypothetical protein